jgi:hypothetical protein
MSIVRLCNLRYPNAIAELGREDGTVLSGDAQARKQAITTAAEIIRSDAATLPSNELWEMVVTDETGRRMLTLRFSAEDHPVLVAGQKKTAQRAAPGGLKFLGMRVNSASSLDRDEFTRRDFVPCCS